MLLGFKTLANPKFPVPIPRHCLTHQSHPNHLSIGNANPNPNPNPRKFTLHANGDPNNNDGPLSTESNSGATSNGDGNGEEEEGELKREKQWSPFNLNWGKLLLDPDPDNVFAVGLTGLLTWASVQVVWQLVVVSWAILVAGLKYSFVAALLIFILIALL